MLTIVMIKNVKSSGHHELLLDCYSQFQVTGLAQRLLTSTQVLSGAA